MNAVNKNYKWYHLMAKQLVIIIIIERQDTIVGIGHLIGRHKSTESDMRRTQPAAIAKFPLPG